MHFGLNEFMAGGMAGASGIAVGHPIDTVRIRYQLEQSPVLSILKETIRKESIWGLYKGLASPLSSCFVFNAILFYSYNYTKNHFDKKGSNRFFSMLMGGTMGGIACAFVTCPTELIKIKVQMMKDKRGMPYSGSWSCLSHTVKTEGILGLSRGMSATMLRDVPGYIIYFLTYNVCKEKFVGENNLKVWEQNSSQIFGQLAAGSLAGVLGWLPGYPFEVVKTRIQAGRYDSVLFALRDGIKREGFSVFYRGIGIAIIRAVPVNAVTFLVYEVCMDLLTHFRT